VILELPKAYQPQAYETDLYRKWEESGLFNPDKLPNAAKRKPFTIAMPLPNITGELHLGHALMLTLQDLMIRFERMRGRAALWIPGTDHAGIATQIVVEKSLQKEGINPRDLSREEFLKHAWAWKKQYGEKILVQVRAMGASCDWSRYHFTLDADYSAAVREAFVRFFDAGLITRGTRVINWCVKDQTAVSDLEVVHRNESGHLWHIRYPFADDAKNGIVIATTRPETMLGDTAVAVHPKDDRYKKLIGKKLRLPLVEGEAGLIPIVGDDAVEKEFGTGAVKVTPAHDTTDEAIGKRHDLPSRIVIGTNGKMTDAAGAAFAGLPMLEAREKVLAELKSQKLLVKTEVFEHAVAYCERSNTRIEPLPLPQWFLKMEKLAKPALTAVKKGKIEIVPERYTKVYVDWLENIRDWNISRQLRWGHRIPVWTCGEGHEFASREETPTKCASCNSTRLTQDPDVLDTWFSSQLWTFATLGWPNEAAPDFKRFHPTSVMETGWDILFFWVARMVMASLYLTGEIPFHTVYLHGLVLDSTGKKMSKSKGTGIDPLPMGQKYGTDAVRLSLVLGTTPGQDTKLTEPKIAGYRNFVNKLWNIARFVTVSMAGAKPKKTLTAKTLADQWILSRLAKAVAEVTEHIENYRFSAAGERLYEFTWHELADWYLEIAKVEKPLILPLILQKVLKLWHPFAPYVTETLWQNCFPNTGFLIVADWPVFPKRYINESAERLFDQLKTSINGYRKERTDKKIPPNEVLTVQVPGDNLLWAHREIVERLGRVKLELPPVKLEEAPPKPRI
jgi:valyl-tRNA synthetase